MKKVNFFIVGFPRTGTTTLYNYFQNVDNVYLPKKKQLYHFEKDFNNIRKESGKSNLEELYNFKIDSYQAYYENVSDEKVIMEITPSYIFSKSAAKEIADYNPNAKILIILREPVSFLISYFNIVRLNGIETESSILQGLGVEKERKKINSLNNTHEPISFLYYRELIKYNRYLKRYFDVFPKKNIEILVYEEIEDNTEAFINSIYKFMDIDAKIPRQISKVNTSAKSIFINDMSTLRNNKLQSIKKYIPGFLLDILKSTTRQLLTKKVTRSEEEYNKVYQILIEEVKACVSNTKKILGEQSYTGAIVKIEKYWKGIL